MKCGEEIQDEYVQEFGLRLAEADESRVYVNKKPVFLRGATEHAYFPQTCTVPNDREYYQRELKCLKSYGFNWVRFHTWIPPVECLEEADRLGIYFQIEAENGSLEEEWLAGIYSCRKHPSVILYCCGNEVRMDEPMLDFLEKMAEHVHTLAPGTLFNPMEALRGLEYDVDDILTVSARNISAMTD